MAKSTTPRSAAPRKSRASKTAAAPAPVPAASAIVPEREAVAIRAYELFLASGSVHGHDLEHWLRAERELFGGLLISAA